MSAIHVEVTAADIAGAKPGTQGWAMPVEAALARLTGQQVDVDGGDGTTNIATIGQGAWTVVIDLPMGANRWLNARWNDGSRNSRPFAFDIDVPDWIVALVEGRGHRPDGSPR